MTYIIKTHEPTRVHDQHRQEARNSGSVSVWWFWPLDSVVIDSHLTLIPLFRSERVHPFTTRITPWVHSVSHPRAKPVFRKTSCQLLSPSGSYVAGTGEKKKWERFHPSHILVLKPFSGSRLCAKHTFNGIFRLGAVRADVEHVKWTILPLVTHSREALYCCLEESKHSNEIICVSWCTVYKCDTTTSTYVQSKYIWIRTICLLSPVCSF